MTECFLPDEQIRELDRDLRILIATNGTLTRILSVVANEEIVVQVVKQHVHHSESGIADSNQLATGRVLQRHILLRGRSSGNPFVAAESLIAIDRLPTAIMTSLTNTDHPIGEIMAASRLETFKEVAKVWIGELPGWLALADYQNSPPRIVSRRYRIIAGGQPALIITEHFLQNVFHVARCAEPDRCNNRTTSTQRIENDMHVTIGPREFLATDKARSQHAE